MILIHHHQKKLRQEPFGFLTWQCSFFKNCVILSRTPGFTHEQQSSGHQGNRCRFRHGGIGGFDLSEGVVVDAEDTIAAQRLIVISIPISP